MAVLAAGVGRLYGSKDESNGRVNPALEPDYDMEPDYPAVDQTVRGGGGVVGVGGGGATGGSQPYIPVNTGSGAAFGSRQAQNTAF